MQMNTGRLNRSCVQVTRWPLSLGRWLQARRSTAARTALLLASFSIGVVAQPVADFNALPKHGAKPLQVSFIDLSTSSVPITSWLWDFGDSATSTAQHPIKTYTASGSYPVSLTVTSSQGSDSVIKAGFINVPPPGLFGAQLVLPNSPTSDDVAVADFNGDGAPDLLATKANSSVGVHWWQSLGAVGEFGPAQLITDENPAASTIDAADIDGDGDMDVLAGYVQLDKVVWHENTDGLGAFGPERTVVSFALTCSGVESGDIDGDGDIDVLSTLALAGKLAWNANSGAGTFGPKTVLATFGSSASGVLSSRLADLDGDGDLDVLAGYGYSAGPGLPGQNNQLVWFPNADGLGGYGGAQLLDTALSLPGAIEGVDVDDDGDLDVLAGSAYDGQVNWYENTDGAASFGPSRTIREPVLGTAQVVSFTTADVDLDGDLDVVAAEEISNRLVLLENMDGLGDSWSEVLISNQAGTVRDV
ncbi:MAG: PKD repeat protein, partial [Pseudohongiellaceae bacterium]